MISRLDLPSAVLWGAIIQFAALSCRFLVSPLCRLVRGRMPPSRPLPGSKGHLEEAIP